ncbi:cytochrome P450 [Aspergillus sclerotioniger CBS 115572]|uniref:Cytochrome P450 n=1 Tax=Aspergillus sclerotioniger CBS 115572 TaxID=1450535 RepID=A0A317WJI1_9EURO|nr:cytochrome P450 [Aspergillus sclerotioniger CBS 115572]PWY85811.1 cytochrome P450 [Aspergillus sclerotioniger CBS 115572]
MSLAELTANGNQLAQIPAGEPPHGVIPNLKNPPSDGYLLFIIGGVGVTIMLVVVALRFYAHVVIRKVFKAEDCASCILYFFNFSLFSFSSGCLSSTDRFTNATVGSALIGISSYFTNWVTLVVWAFVKNTFLLMYLDIFRPLQYQRFAIYIGLFVNWTFYTVVLSVILALTSPAPGQSWLDCFMSDRQAHMQSWIMPVAAGNLILDTYILLLPIGSVMRLQLSRRKKLAVLSVFATGFVACIASAVSIYYKQRLAHNLHDLSYHTLPVLISALLEMCVGVTASCMPAMALLIRTKGHPLIRLTTWAWGTLTNWTRSQYTKSRSRDSAGSWYRRRATAHPASFSPAFSPSPSPISLHIHASRHNQGVEGGGIRRTYDLLQEVELQNIQSQNHLLGAEREEEWHSCPGMSHGGAPAQACYLSEDLTASFTNCRSCSCKRISISISISIFTMAEETIYTWLFTVACVFLILSELYYSLHLIDLTHQRNRHFYRPWAPKPILIPPTKKMMMELSEASALSQRAVYADMIGLTYSLNGFDHHEVSKRKARLFGRAMLVVGAAKLPTLYPYLIEKVTRVLATELGKVGGGRAGTLGLDTRSVSVTVLSEQVMAEFVGLWIFGENLWSDLSFRNGLVRLPQLKRTVAVFQLTPRFMAPVIHALLAWGGKAKHKTQDRLRDLISGVEEWNEPPEIKELTLLNDLIELSAENRDYWTPERLSQSTLGLWLAASHQPWVNLTAILLELSARPEWQDRLRAEAAEYADDSDLANHIDGLPLLDSFLRETTRMNVLDRVAIRRKALADYTFSTGSPSVPAGSTLCVSSYNLARDASIYLDPEHFDGARFLNGRSNDPHCRYADPSYILDLLTNLSLRTSSKNPHEPLSVTIAGETLYLISNPSHATELARNPAISRDPLVVEIYTKLGIPRAVVARLLAIDPDAPGTGTDTSPSLNAIETILEMYREYLSPGPMLDTFFDRDVLPRIQDAFAFALDSDGSGSGTPPLSLHTLVTTAQIKSLLGAYYGDLIFTLEPDFVEHYLVWEKVNWKFVFRVPHLFSADMLAAQRTLVGAFRRYAAVPSAQRGHANEWTERVEGLLRGKGVHDEDLGWIFMLQTWAILGNTYKSTFWLVAHILADPALLQAITAEIQPALTLRAESGTIEINHQYLSEHCPQLDSLYSEVLRLTMTAPMILRGGNKVMLLYHHLHLDPSTWGSSPETLHPTRFLHSPWLKNNPAYRPWGAGRHAIFAFVACLFGRFEVVDTRVVGQGGFPRMDMSKPTPGIASITWGDDVLLKLRRKY